MCEPPIRRRSGWGEMFFSEEKAFPHIRDRTPREIRRSRFERKRRSKGADAVFAAGGNGVKRTLRRCPWGEMFFSEKKAFPRIRDRDPDAAQRSGCGGKRQSSRLFGLPFIL